MGRNWNGSVVLMVAVTIMSDIPPQLKKIKRRALAPTYMSNQERKGKKKQPQKLRLRRDGTCVSRCHRHTNVELELLDVAHRGEEDKSDCAIGVKVVSA